MPVPDYQTLMLPVLRAVGSQNDGGLSQPQLRSRLATELNLQEPELQELLPSGSQPLFHNRVHWATFYLKKAGLVTTPKRGLLRITPRGKEVLSSNPSRIDNNFLRQFPEFVTWIAASSQKRETPSPKEQLALPTDDSTTPAERIEAEFARLREELAEQVLERVKQCSPAFFERLVIELLLKMGYGGSRADAGRAIGRSGDEGIDGIIKEDKLGLDTIYIQAKRWKDNAVGRPAIQQFAGALAGQGAHKGIFITTSTFTDDARAFIAKVNSKIVLIDGEELANLMIEHGIGVATTVVYDVKRVDSDYFAEGEE
jgi:restriction system protein